MSKTTKTASKIVTSESAPIVAASAPTTVSDKKTKQPKTTKSVVTETDTKSVVAKSETVKSETVKSATAKSATAKSATVKSATVKSATVKSATVKSATVKTETTDEPVVLEMTGSTVEPVNAVLIQSTEFLAKLTQLSSLIANIKTEYRSLEKKMTRELKLAQKNGAKRKRKTGNRAPSGFVKPTLISDELATFLEKPSGTEMARTDVTREINKYIRSHDLQDKSNGRKINADDKLSSLLKLKTTDELTYFNLQRYMSVHFQKSAAALAALSSSV